MWLVLLAVSRACAEWIGGTEALLNTPRHRTPCKGKLLPGTWTNETWIPTGCVYFRWDSAQSRRCLAKSTVVFLGGAHERNLFRCFVDLISHGRSRGAYHGANRLSCENFEPSQDDLTFVMESAAQKGAPPLELRFFWNPLISWSNKWCHTDMCVRSDGVPPADAGCSCPSAAKVGAPFSYTGARVRAPFLRGLLEEGLRPDYVVSGHGLGEVTQGFVETLATIPTLVVTYNPTHAIHEHDGVEESKATLVDFSLLTKAQKHLVVNGHATGALMHTIVHTVLSLMSFHVCPWERKFLHGVFSTNLGFRK